ncbi:MAG: glycosyltransferase [Caldilineaceae bacterium]|nr:glycosyltransferase [Caldilineaceae bacterium]
MTFSVSVITTVYNEEHAIERLLHSLASQTRPPNEVILCDGGSTDKTVALVQRFRREDPTALPNLQILVEPGANISRGRNVAIAAAAGPIIAVTDAGVRLTPDWLAHLVAPWEDAGEEPIAVAGFFLPDVEGDNVAQKIFRVAMAATVLPLVDDIDPNKFLPSSRSVAFTKTAWMTAGGYPEWLDYCEDLIFDFRINAQRPTAPTAFGWAPKALVYFQPRTSLRAFWTQYYRYARGDGKADLWRKRQAVRYLTYLVALPALVGHALWGSFAPWLGWLGLLGGMFVYCRRPWQRIGALAPAMPLPQQLTAAALVPLIRVIGDLAKMVGYPVGLWWRRQHRATGEIDWRRNVSK